MIKKLWKYARFGVLLLLVFLISISSHPTIVDISDSANMYSGTVLSRYIDLVFVVLVLMCFNIKSIVKCRTFVTSMVIFMFIILFYLITCSFYGTDKMMGDARAIFISILAIMVGWQMDLDKKGLYFLLLLFAGLVLYVGLMQVRTNIGGFTILDQYESDNKNALGVMLSTAAIVFVFLGLNWKEIGWLRFIFFAVALLTLVVTLTIRARAATIGLGIMLVYIFWERYNNKKMWLYLIIGVVLVVVAYKVMPQSAKDYVYNSFYQNYENDDVTSDRMRRNMAAIKFLSQHFWVGNLNAYTNLAWIHNYPLEKLYKFGFIFAFPILFMYLYLLIVAIVKSIRSDNHNIYYIGYYLLLLPYIVSMAEPTFPFGPGTATIFNFILFGIALKSTYTITVQDESQIVNSQQDNDE